jgi:hypothetical protein
LKGAPFGRRPSYDCDQKQKKGRGKAPDLSRLLSRRINRHRTGGLDCRSVKNRSTNHSNAAADNRRSFFCRRGQLTQLDSRHFGVFEAGVFKETPDRRDGFVLIDSGCLNRQLCAATGA